MAKLDRKEKELLESFERGEWKSVRRLESERGRYQTFAESTFKKNRRVNIRISEKDLEAIQKAGVRIQETDSNQSEIQNRQSKINLSDYPQSKIQNHKSKITLSLSF